MQEPENPTNEHDRLAALNRLNVLDTPPEERFDRFTRLAKRIFQVPIALVSLVDSQRQWFKSSQGLGATETPRNISFCGHAILQDEALIIPDTIEDPRFSDNPLVTGDPRIRFYAGVPLKAPGGENIGTLCIIDSEPRTFGLEDESLLVDIAEMVELDLASLALATTDELTGLSNRRGLREIARHAIARARRDVSPLALIYFDLDDFKRINDQFGHATGDHALRAFSELLIKAFRQSDIIARNGGDEFCVLLSDVEQSGANRALARLRELAAEFNRTNEKPYKLSFSAGLAFAKTPDSYDLGQLLTCADQAMYDEKKRRSDKQIAA